MQTKITSEPTGLPVPAVIPEPVRLRGEVVAHGAATSRRRNPASKLLSALRGDKYMVGAYPPGKER
jgi:hypothetical protein